MIDIHTLDSHTWAFPRGDTPRKLFEPAAQLLLLDIAHVDLRSG